MAEGRYPIADCPRCGRHDLRIDAHDWGIRQTCGYQTDRHDLPAGVITPRNMNLSMADIKERLATHAGCTANGAPEQALAPDALRLGKTPRGIPCLHLLQTFTLEEAHAAASAGGTKPSRRGNRGWSSFNSRACRVGGDNPNGCWATEKDGRVYFHCHNHSSGKSDRLEAQRRITPHMGLPVHAPPGPSYGNGQPYLVSEQTYHNRLTGEEAVQVVE